MNLRMVSPRLLGAITSSFFRAVLVFLHESCDLEYNVLSAALQSPLHVAALHGQWQTVAFLLRNQVIIVISESSIEDIYINRQLFIRDVTLAKWT